MNNPNPGIGERPQGEKAGESQEGGPLAAAPETPKREVTPAEPAPPTQGSPTPEFVIEEPPSEVTREQPPNQIPSNPDHPLARGIGSNDVEFGEPLNTGDQAARLQEEINIKANQ